MFKKIILLSSISASLVACSGSGKAPTVITQDNATSVSKAVLQQVTGVAKQAQVAGSKKSTASSKSTASAGITIEQSTSTIDINYTEACQPSSSQNKSQVSAGITIEQGITGLDVYYEACPKTESSSESSGTGITIAQSISDLLITLCLNTDGTADFNYDDSNSNSILDLGEVSHANYNNCQFTESLSFDGKQSTTVTEFFPSYKSTVSNNNYSITENGKTSTSNGSVSLSASDTNGVQNFRSEFNEFSETTGIETTTLHSGFIETSFSNSSYEVTQDTVISGSSFSGKLTIKTAPSLKGSMLNGEIQPPSSGKLKATAEDGSYIIIDADDGDNNTDTFNLTVNNGATLTTVQKWSEL